MTKLAALDTNAEARQQVINCLRDYLARAEAGEFRSVYLCVIRIEDGELEQQSAGGYSTFEVLGAVETMKHVLLAKSMK